MYCPNCQNRFDEFQNCYKSTEEVVNDNYYYSYFIKCPHCKTYLVQEKLIAWNFSMKKFLLMKRENRVRFAFPFRNF